MQAAFAAGASAAAADGPYEHRVVVWDEVGEEEGTGIVHIAPGCGAEDFALGKSLGLPMIAPLDENGVVIAGLRAVFGSGRARRHGTDRRVAARTSTASTGSRRSPTATRTAGAAARRSYSASWTSGTSAWARSTTSRATELTTAEVDASLRYQIMEVIEGITLDSGVRVRARARLAPEHARLDDQQEALLGPGAADLRLRGLRRRSTVIGGREELAERAVEGWDAVRRPHAPSALRGRGQDRAARAAARPCRESRDVGNPWLDAGIVPFSTMHFRIGPRVLEAAGSRPTS